MRAIIQLIAGISFCLYVIGCSSQGDGKVKTEPSTLTTDSIKTGNRRTDTEAFNSINLPKILKDYIEGYKKTIEVDTSFNFNEKKLEIVFKHYCTYDSALHLPSRYVRVYGLEKFVTHNFKSTIKISLGESIIIDTVISKELFKDEIFEEEEMYGALLYPSLSFSKKDVTVDYSISVPLTDVGVGVSLECRYDGKVIVRKN
ncbi:MAG: hypothetical protein JST68_14625 [Bacteroidetes bacterium]|nr:hypothetical protein [Bacteroidota bacterium]